MYNSNNIGKDIKLIKFYEEKIGKALFVHSQQVDTYFRRLIIQTNIVAQ